jgi:hypothetical protein
MLSEQVPNWAALNKPVPTYLQGIPPAFLTPRAIRFLRQEHERKKKHRFRRERCFSRFRVLELDQIRGLPKAGSSTRDSGVYFLWNGPRLMYIGKASAVHDRLADHKRKQKPFTHATFEAPLNVQGK